MMRISFGRLILALSFGLLAGGMGSGCGGGSGAGNGSGGAGAGTGGSGSGGGTGSGGSPTGSGGSSGGGTGGAAPGTGGAGTADGGGSGGTPVDGGGEGAAGTGGGLHGGTSGKYICPPGASYAGMMPAMSGMFTMSTGGLTNNGEGPIWLGSMSTLFFTSKFQGDAIRQIWKLVPPDAAQVSVKTNVGNNGMTLDNDDKIISADHQLSAIVRLDPATGAMLGVVADQYNGAYFQSPNDVIVRGDGNIYFSDPAYFATQGKRPKTAGTAFYRISPAGQVSMIDNTGKDPNGVALSPDDNTLYTLVTADQQVKKWALNADGSINGAGTSFAMTSTVPDGICVDCAGNVYVATTGAGVQVFSPAGQLVTTVGGGKAINCSFGGADHKTLFITSDTHIRWGTVNIPGLP